MIALTLVQVLPLILPRQEALVMIGGGTVFALFESWCLLNTQLPEQIDTLLLRPVLVDIVSLVAVFYLKTELESGATLAITEDSDVTSLVFANDLTQSKSQAYSLRIHPATTLDKNKRLPNALLVFRGYPWTLILHDHGEHNFWDGFVCRQDL